jgi:predicted RNA-binding Zn ribbon-like protein
METRRPSTRDPEPAPGRLELVQAFLNTAKVKENPERLASPRQLGRWLAHRGLLPAATELQAVDLQRALDLREGLRGLLAGHRGAEVPVKAFDRLEAAIGDTSFRLRFDHDGTLGLEAAPQTFDAALAKILEAVLWARSEGLWRRLKTCRNAECRRALFDTTKSLTTKWCTRRCGERMRGRSYRGKRANQ